MGTLNKKIAGRTKDSEELKNYRKEYDKKYKEEHKEQN